MQYIYKDGPWNLTETMELLIHLKYILKTNWEVKQKRFGEFVKRLNKHLSSRKKKSQNVISFSPIISD